MQESLSNAIRHSGANEVSIRLEIDTEVQVSISDNGKGCDDDTLTAIGGFGLRGLADRVELVCGSFTAGPQPLGGFAVNATLPLSTVHLVNSSPQKNAALVELRSEQ